MCYLQKLQLFKQVFLKILHNTLETIISHALYHLLYLHIRDSATVLHSVDGTLTWTQYVCVYVYMYVRMYVYNIYVGTRMYLRTHVCM
jgi:hypothetical protein